MSDFDMVRHFIEGSAPFWTDKSYGEALATFDRIEAEYNKWQDLFADLVDENARLRAALENLLTYDLVDEQYRLRSIARTALEGSET